MGLKKVGLLALAIARCRCAYERTTDPHTNNAPPNQCQTPIGFEYYATHEVECFVNIR